MPKQFELPLEERLLLRARDVGGLLCISERAVWRLADEGSLPKPVQIGSALRWRRADIDAAVAAMGADSAPGINAAAGCASASAGRSCTAPEPSDARPKRTRKSPRAAVNEALEALRLREWGGTAQDASAKSRQARP